MMTKQKKHGQLFHTIFKDGTKSLNADIPEGTMVEFVLTSPTKEETRLDFSCVDSFFLGQANTIENLLPLDGKP